MQGSAIFFDALSPRHGSGFAFDVWYMNHYLPCVLRSRPYLGMRRYGSPSLGIHLAIFEAAALPPVEARRGLPGHDDIVRTERYVAKQAGERIATGAGRDALEANFVYPVFFRVPADREAEFDAWYTEEHLAILLRCPYWPMCRRFKVIDPGPDSPTHLALHYLTDLRALESDERTRARSTPWRDRLAREPWFRGDYRVYHRCGSGGAA